MLIKHKRKNYKKLYEEQQKLVNDYTETLKRLQADFENFKKRTEKQNSNLQIYANQKLLCNFLPILDDFENSIKHLDKTNEQDLKKGLLLIHQKLKQTLEGEGVKEIQCIHQKLDPFKHEVLLQECSNKENGTILEEIQKGYTYKDSILRHSKVKISKGGDTNGRK